MASAGGIRAGGAWVELGAKVEGLDKALQQAEAKLSAFGKGVAGIGAMVLAAGTGIVAPFIAAAQSFADAGSELNDMAGRTGISVEALSALGFAAGMTGADMGTVEGAVRKMQKALVKGSQENLAAESTFAALGLSIQELSALSPDKQFEAVAAAIAQIKDPTAKAAAAMEIFGKSGTALLPMIDDLAALTGQAKDFGLVWTTDEAEKADALGDAVDLLKGTLSRVVQVIGSALAPMLTDLAMMSARVTATVIAWVKANEPLIVTIFKIGVGLAALGGTIIGLGFGIIGLGKAFGFMSSAMNSLSVVAAAVSSVFGVLSALFAVILSPIGLVIIGLTSLAAWFAITSGAGGKALAWLGDRFGELWGRAQKAFGGIADALSAGDIVLAGKILWAALKGEWIRGTTALATIWAGWTGDSSSVLGFWASAAQKAWDAIVSGFGQVVTFLSQDWGTIASQVGDFVGGAVDSFMGLVSSIEGGASSIANTFTDTIVSAATGAWATISGGVQSFVAGTVEFFVGLGSSIMDALAPAISFLSAVWQAVGAPIATFIGTVVGAFLDFASTVLGAFGEVASSLAGVFMAVVGPILNVVGTIVGAFLGLAASIIGTFLAAAGSVINTMAGIVSSVAGALKSVAAPIGSFLGAMVGAFLALSGAAVGVFGGIASFVAGALTTAGGYVGDFIGSAISLFLGLGGSILGVFGRAISFLGDGLATIGGLIGGFIGAFVTFAGSIMSAFGGVVSFFGDVWATIAGTIGGFIGTTVGAFLGLAGSITGAMAGVVSFFAGVWQAVAFPIGDFIGSAIGMFVGFAASIVEAFAGVASFLTSGWEAISGTIVGFIDGIGSAWLSVTGMIMDAFDGVISFLVSGWTTIADTVVGFVSGAVDLFSGLGSTIMGAFGGVGTFLKGLWDSGMAMFTGLMDGTVSLASLMISAYAGVQSAWVIGTSAITDAFAEAWVLIRNGWNGLWNFLAGIFDGFVGGTSKKLIDMVALIQAQIAIAKGLFSGTDSTGELAKIGQDRDAKKSAIDKDIEDKAKGRVDATAAQDAADAKARDKREADKQAALAGIGQAEMDQQQALKDQQAAGDEASRQAAEDAVSASAEGLALSQDEIDGLLAEAGLGVPEDMVAAKRVGPIGDLSPEGLDQAVKDTKAKVDVAGSFSAAGLAGLGIGDTISDDQLKEQKGTNDRLDKLNKLVEKKKVAFA